MFPRQTVFIVGAGASHDFGLPTGDELRDTLIGLLARHDEHFRFRHRHLNDAVQSLTIKSGGQWTTHFQKYLDAASRIQLGLPLAISIDNYLHAHRDDEIVQSMGKIAITTAILEAERSTRRRLTELPDFVRKLMQEQ